MRTPFSLTRFIRASIVAGLSGAAVALCGAPEMAAARPSSPDIQARYEQELLGLKHCGS